MKVLACIAVSGIGCSSHTEVDTGIMVSRKKRVGGNRFFGKRCCSFFNTMMFIVKRGQKPMTHLYNKTRKGGLADSKVH